MRHWVRVAALAIGGILLADTDSLADCTGLLSPPSSTMTKYFDDMIATQSSPATCNGLSVPTTVAPGSIGVFSADYRGAFDYAAAVGELTVTNNGMTESTTSIHDPASANDIYFSHLIGSDSSGNLVSNIRLDLLQSLTVSDAAALDSIDYNLLASAKLTDIQASANQFAADHTALITHLNATGDLLTGAGHPLEEPDGVSVFGGVGSYTTGATARLSLGNGFTVLGGAAVFGQSAGGASASGLLFSGSLRYLAPDQALVRPYGEVGLISAPAIGLSFSRSYVTSNGTTSATGSATGAMLGGFVKGGALLTPDENNQVVLSATFARDWLMTGAYSETLDGSNIFAATAPAQSSGFDTIKAGIDWTTKVALKTALTLSGAIGQTMAENPVAANVAFAGVFSGAPVSETFAEYGVRVGYELDAAQSVGAFLHGSTGQISGSHVQVGGDYHVDF